MPGIKQRTVRRKKICPPHKRKGPSAPSHKVSASRKKLVNSPSSLLSKKKKASKDSCQKGKRTVVLEKESVSPTLESAVVCKHCLCGPVTFQEDETKSVGLYTNLYLRCVACGEVTEFPFSSVNDGKALSINRKVIFANKCIGGTRASLETFCAMLDLPSPVAQQSYRNHTVAINAHCVAQANNSMSQARNEVRELYGATGDCVPDITISSDGTWQKRGFSSLYGAVFAIEYESGKVVDYQVLSRYCSGCKYWEKRDHESEKYKEWKKEHESSCEANYEGSAASMEPKGISMMYGRSLDNNLRYKQLICDGDCKTHSLLLEQKPYGPGKENEVIKVDCVGHVQKRMGTALRNLKKDRKGEKLSDGKTIGGAGRLTKALIDTLQNYYGMAIRSCKGDLRGMMQAVQASLLHCNSTDETPRHQLCPVGEASWCKWQKAKAKNEPFQHKKKPLPAAILELVKPIYQRLGSKNLLERCLGGYTQNPNESLHAIVWKLCPKELFLGKLAIDTACAIAVCIFNDGITSLQSVSDSMGLQPTKRCQTVLRSKDYSRIKKSDYKASDRYKKLRKASRAKRKGFEDKHEEEEGVVYSAGAFDTDVVGPGPSKRAKKS